ncbi:uncharacterized protein STEHIDRAFT_150406 [Stereum hirsutum FP-91666 SS1]|uniref:uncharacterized protein n=1 Tax=Stereum hirsutum (strain FP-91666) TaxID=721885 RepID=UPI0004449C33|nr:uncharacterized protein STEHIDRAFT_150406 [Stereum hirsutum FP-91666 SS1]EIM80703.1 hypothetical protein STEHIDRAFT_150406 [Stereum hirsutum FP-91666 SS1]
MSTMTITHSPVLTKTVFQSSWNADAYSSPLPEIGFLRLFDDNFVVGFGEAQNSTPRLFFDAPAEKMNTYKTLDTTHATPSPDAASQIQYLVMPPAPKLRSIPLPAFDDEEDLFSSLGGGEPMEVDDAPHWPAAFSVRGPSTSGAGHSSLSDTESEASAQGEMSELRNALELTHLSPHQTFGATF